MKRRVLALALSFLFCVVGIAAKPRGEPPAAAVPAGAKPPVSPLAETSPDPSLLAEVSRLVEASLEALRDRRDHRHQAFLKESLAKLPGFAPARWHSGYVQLGGGWVHIDHVPYLAGDNPALVKYAELREQADQRHYSKATTAESSRTQLINRQRDSTAGRLDTYRSETLRVVNSAGYSPGYVRAQESLALWCGQNGLAEEARVHWAQVLTHEPTHRVAAAAWGMVEIGGRFVPQEHVERAWRLHDQIVRSKERWYDRIVDLEREAASFEPARRTSAISELRTIGEPAAVFALHAACLRQALPRDQRPEYVEAFHREVIALIGSFDTQPATESLVRFAVQHQLKPVREFAAKRLTGRAPHSFAPHLLAGLTMPIQYFVTMAQDGGRRVVHVSARQEHENYIAGLRDTRQVYNPRHLRLMTRAASARVNEVKDFNAQADQLNRRIAAALSRAMPSDAFESFSDLAHSSEFEAPDPQRWWDWWYAYNEQYVSDDKPYVGYDYGWTAYDNYQPALPRRTSCFAKGTPVWTLSGPKQIETIKIGDRVLAQNPETGELSYNGVLVTTLRPPSKMLTIHVGKSTITTTLGHPFFVVGKGWRMAKELTDDDWLCAQGQTLPIDAIERAEPAEAHNLMVADFGTYFVGKDRILVHDNSPIPPARLEMPGLLAARK